MIDKTIDSLEKELGRKLDKTEKLVLELVKDDPKYFIRLYKNTFEAFVPNENK